MRRVGHQERRAHVGAGPALLSIASLLAWLSGCGIDSTGSTGGQGGQGGASSSESASTGEALPRCDDQLKNGDETALDCGGSCKACPYGANCLTNADCEAVCGPDNECTTAPSTAWRNAMVTGPVGRRGFAMSRDAMGHALLFGGIHEVNAVGVPLGDLYRYDGKAWTPIVPSPTEAWPPARHSAGFAYDTDAHVALLFGGAGTVVLDDLWLWNGSTWAPWSKAAPSDAAPVARFAASLAYDPVRRLTVLFGGFTTTGALDDTWVFDQTVAPGKWTKIDAPKHPSARLAASMAFDGPSGRVMLFGGSTGPDVLGDQWTFDGATWTEVKPAVLPPKRASAAMARDVGLDRVVLAGGGIGSGLLADSWVWDGAKWTEIDRRPPAGQAGNAMEFDETLRRIVLYPSYLGTATYATDTWEHFQVGELCLSTSECPSGSCVNGACCYSLSCGECERCDTPLSAGFCAPDPEGCE